MERGWKAHVLGEAPKTFKDALEAVTTLRVGFLNNTCPCRSPNEGAKCKTCRNRGRQCLAPLATTRCHHYAAMHSGCTSLATTKTTVNQLVSPVQSQEPASQPKTALQQETSSCQCQFLQESLLLCCRAMRRIL